MVDDAKKYRPTFSETRALSPGALVCRGCGGRAFFVKSKTDHTNGTIMRRRQCVHCGLRVTTRETVIKHSQKTEPLTGTGK